MIDFHYFVNGNPLKVGIMLEETGLEHNLIRYEMVTGDHLTPEFRKINPNNKLPVIVDRDPACGGGPLRVFESGAILMYLAEKTGQLLPTDFRRRWEAQQWLAWQISGLGPFHGQAHHFKRYAPEGQEYGVKRYLQEAERLLNVAERRLSEVDYFAGEYSVADIACFPWLMGIDLLDFSWEAYPAIAAWKERVASRPAVVRLFARPEFQPDTHFMQKRVEVDKEQWSALFGDKHLAASRE